VQPIGREGNETPLKPLNERRTMQETIAERAIVWAAAGGFVMALAFPYETMSAELSSVKQAQADRGTSFGGCGSCGEQQSIDYSQDVRGEINRTGINALDTNQQTINDQLSQHTKELLVQQAQYEELLATASDAPASTLGMATVLQKSDERITALQADLDGLRTDAANWSSMAAAMDSGYLRADERFALSLNTATIGGGGAGALNATARLTRQITVNGSAAWVYGWC